MSQEDADRPGPSTSGAAEDEPADRGEATKQLGCRPPSVPRLEQHLFPHVCITNVQATVHVVETIQDHRLPGGPGVFLAYFPPYKLQNTRSAQKYVKSSAQHAGVGGEALSASRYNDSFFRHATGRQGERNSAFLDEHQVHS